MIAISLFIFVAGCRHAQDDAIAVKPIISNVSTKAANVAVIINMNSDASKTIGSYYVKKRGIPSSIVIMISPTTDNQLPWNDYRYQIEEPIRTKLRALKAIDYIVLTKGVPIRVWDGAGYSVDSLIASMDMPGKAQEEPAPKLDKVIQNPYYKKSEPFSKAKFGFYLVTRLDGYTLEDAKKLVDNSIAAKSEKGKFFLDAMPVASNGGFFEMNETLKAAGILLTKKGFDAETDFDPTFKNPGLPLMGYASWGSNDGHFDAGAYSGLKFKPGALAETFVSTSARSFAKVTGGQSMIADLIAQGVTGVKGYVSEPYTVALAHPDILFDRYTSGFNLAESFFMASPLLRWKDLVIGDPLCSPYAKK